MKVLSVRLPDEVYTKLEERADFLGIPPAVLARAYIKERLEGRDDISRIAPRHLNAGVMC